MSKVFCGSAILLALAACATPPPSVTVVHTVPPTLNIIPAKSVAVIVVKSFSIEWNAMSRSVPPPP